MLQCGYLYLKCNTCKYHNISIVDMIAKNAAKHGSILFVLICKKGIFADWNHLYVGV